MFAILNDVFAFFIKSPIDNAVKEVQGKPTDVTNLSKIFTGAILCYIALTILMYFTLSFDYFSTFTVGACVYAISESSNYATFDKWPIYMILLQTLVGGIYFVVIKAAYRLIITFKPFDTILSSNIPSNGNRSNRRNASLT